jgi:polyisoprenoid-binding protein YceI
MTPPSRPSRFRTLGAIGALAVILFGTFLPTPASLAAAAPRRFLIGEGSQVSYHVKARILGVVDDAITGVNRKVTGEVLLASRPSGWALAEARDFESGQRTRDEHVAQILGAPQTPAVRFVLDRLEGFDPDRPEGRISARGTLTARGRDHALTIPLDYRLDGDQLRIQGEAPLRFSDFGIEPPVVGLVFKRAPDALTIRLSLIAREAASK